MMHIVLTNPFPRKPTIKKVYKLQLGRVSERRNAMWFTSS